MSGLFLYSNKKLYLAVEKTGDKMWKNVNRCKKIFKSKIKHKIFDNWVVFKYNLVV